jgi:hypothetical protein
VCKFVGGFCTPFCAIGGIKLSLDPPHITALTNNSSGAKKNYGQVVRYRREIATASPINHNEATSGSVKVEIVLHLRRVLG